MEDFMNVNIEIFWSEEDKEFVAVIKQMPSLSFLAQNPVDALKGLLQTFEDEAEDDCSNNCFTKNVSFTGKD